MQSESNTQFLFETFKNAYFSLFELLVYNLLWIAFTVLVVTAPPAFAGLYYATNQMAHEKSGKPALFFQGFRKYFGISYLWAVVNLVVVLLSLYNVWFYGGYNSLFGAIMQGFFLAVVFLWLMLQMYTFPLLLEQEQPNLWQAIRNSAVIVMQHLSLTMGLYVVLILMYIVSTLVQVPWVLFTVAASAFIANQVVVAIVHPE